MYIHIRVYRCTYIYIYIHIVNLSVLNMEVDLELTIQFPMCLCLDNFWGDQFQGSNPCLIIPKDAWFLPFTTAN